MKIYVWEQSEMIWWNVNLLSVSTLNIFEIIFKNKKSRKKNEGNWPDDMGQTLGE